MTIEIKTNNHERFFKFCDEVPKTVYNDFDHLDEDQKFDGWIHYKNFWYHVTDFMRIENNEHFKGWHGYNSDSFFSGVLIKLSEDSETYQIATYTD